MRHAAPCSRARAPCSHARRPEAPCLAGSPSVLPGHERPRLAARSAPLERRSGAPADRPARGHPGAGARRALLGRVRARGGAHAAHPPRRRGPRVRRADQRAHHRHPGRRLLLLPSDHPRIPGRRRLVHRRQGEPRHPRRAPRRVGARARLRAQRRGGHLGGRGRARLGDPLAAPAHTAPLPRHPGGPDHRQPPRPARVGLRVHAPDVPLRRDARGAPP